MQGPEVREEEGALLYKVGWHCTVDLLGRICTVEE
ncbi:MAG: hypothetical protein JWM16_4229 [Verrucomicrobiales bacterium]|nr:hypothetical protein [Verrucomicrobiales bacterium]